LASIQQTLAAIPEQAWTPAYDADGRVRPGAWVAEVNDLFDLTGWPPGMRLMARRERPHSGAHLRITDVDGHRITAFVTNPPEASWPISSCGTAAAPAPRTASAAPKAPGWPTCPCTTSPPTRSGAPASRSPPT
jgi:hypothetical protein